MNESKEITNDSIDPDVEKYEKRLQAEAEKRAEKILKKNKREINRLKTLYEESLLSGNKEQFIYALGKLRKIYKQSTEHGVLEYCYETSRKAMFKIIEEAKENDTDINI
ncbi:hypothetical protein Pm5461_055 [Proteus phage vB_PmiM_Pm5461]|uniref:Uncharacterized protein n=1 Tax=Proteus phage vB_PmiM_Pm5461 TaxID=1636250 RepID=A0A0G2SSL4_9CAUD|nr:DUF2654 domain-containing protein [Proteus phage vB_PmiM_Pm5461]AKA61917.1 hypothetical protein Pm5461_055 [Proteus phage vB_PmiM_Pm5461]